MCVAAKGRFQGRAATLLLLWAGFSIFFFVFMQQKFSFHSEVVFFLRLVANGLQLCIVADFVNRILSSKITFSSVLHTSNLALFSAIIYRCCYKLPFLFQDYFRIHSFVFYSFIPCRIIPFLLLITI